MQRIAFCAGITDFWDRTFDEVILAYQGKVYEWNVYRTGVDIIRRSIPGAKEADILQIFPLPFDKAEQQNDEDLFEQYNRIRESGVLG